MRGDSIVSFAILIKLCNISHPDMAYWLQKSGRGVTFAQGFTASGISCGIKKNNNDKDLALIVSEKVCSAAGVFTTNVVKAAPVLFTSEILKDGMLQAIVVNSGNANACSGPEGMTNAKNMAELTGEVLGIDYDLVAVCSTGVIGVPLPMDKISTGIFQGAGSLNLCGSLDAARAIMTTDTIPKSVEKDFTIDNKTVRIGGIAKGSGMICPNMATMLSFITTDVNISSSLLHEALTYCVARSFNSITVDGDMSTNDCVLLMASGLSKAPEIIQDSPEYLLFREALLDVMQNLARQIAADGEGATKLIDVLVEGANTYEDARKMGKSIANSSLVKTAVFGKDANWGRILVAAGYAGVDFNPKAVDVHIGDVCVAKAGKGLDFDEEKAMAALSKREVIIKVNLNQGQAHANIWTCDLTHEYIDINAMYRT